MRGKNGHIRLKTAIIISLFSTKYRDDHGYFWSNVDIPCSNFVIMLLDDGLKIQNANINGDGRQKYHSKVQTLPQKTLAIFQTPRAIKITLTFIHRRKKHLETI